jgi:Zn-dependent M28 family amino/carboxypeptidase
MVGSPNYVRFVYDGDASDTDSLGSTGSGVVEDVFTDYFVSQGLATEPTAFDGRSDYDAFINVGIPAGGLFTGAEGIKSAEEAAIYEGVPATTRRATALRRSLTAPTPTPTLPSAQHTRASSSAT